MKWKGVMSVFRRYKLELSIVSVLSVLISYVGSIYFMQINGAQQTLDFMKSLGPILWLTIPAILGCFVFYLLEKMSLMKRLLYFGLISASTSLLLLGYSFILMLFGSHDAFFGVLIGLASLIGAFILSLVNLGLMVLFGKMRTNLQ